MRYRIAIRQSDGEEGFSVSVPGLPGCWSQGATEAEAIENIKNIREYLALSIWPSSASSFAASGDRVGAPIPQQRLVVHFRSTRTYS